MYNNIFFIWIPKCGGSTISEYYNLNCQINNLNNFKYNFYNNTNITFGHSDINILKKNNIISNEFYNNSFKFCIVRNPYCRTVSLYNYLKYNRKVAKTLRIPNSFSFKTYIQYLYLKIKRIPKISEKNIEVYEYINSMWNPMSNWIPDDINKIYYFEDGLQSIINDINKNMKFSKKINKINKLNATKHEYYYKYYDKSTLHMVYEIYKDDFIRFNYPKLI